MHLLLDVRFSEDMCSVCRLLDKNLQQALNIGRKVALNLVSRYKQKNAPKSSLSHIMLKLSCIYLLSKKILQNWFPCKFLNRIRGGNGLRARMRFKNWRPCQFLNFEFLLCKNSAGLFTADILGGGGTDAAGYKPRDVCVSKLELTIVQGCTMVNDWHMLVNIKILARILMFHIGCTFGELRQLRIAKVRKFFSVQNSFST